MDYRIDPIKRMFHELEEANGSVRVRYHGPDGAKEEEMTYRTYRGWLATSPSRGLRLEWVEQVRKPHD